jgi:hypothetical protein
MTSLRSVAVRAFVLVSAVSAVAAVAGTADADELLAVGGWSYRVTPGKDVPGGDLLATESPSAQTCALYCSNDARCVAFAYVDGVATGARANCFLKNGLGSSRLDSHVTTGVKTGLSAVAIPACGSVRMTSERAVERPGGDYKKIEMKPGDVFKFDIAPAIADADRQATACALLCNQQTRCVASTWVKPGVNGPNAMCYLKDSVGPFTSNASAFSSVKLGPARCR